MARGYGLGTTAAPTAATGAASITAANDETYTFSTYFGMVYVSNAFNSGANLYCTVNATAAATDNWDFVVRPGETVSIPGLGPSQMLVNKITVYSDATVTYGTHFVVKGWE